MRKCPERSRWETPALALRLTEKPHLGRQISRCWPVESEVDCLELRLVFRVTNAQVLPVHLRPLDRRLGLTEKS